LRTLQFAVYAFAQHNKKRETGSYSHISAVFWKVSN
jgi:hypothetical protein